MLFHIQKIILSKVAISSAIENVRTIHSVALALLLTSLHVRNTDITDRKK